MKLFRLPKPKGVLFDFDGVVVHSKSMHKEAWAWAFKRCFGQQMRPMSEPLRAGLASWDIAAHLAKWGGSPEKAHILYRLKLERLITRDTLPQMLGGVDTLFKQLEQLRVPFGIASNGPGAFVRHCLKGLELDVPVALGVREVSAPKPDPAPYLELAQRLGLGREVHSQVWVLEDSVLGMRAAIAAKMCGIGVGKDAATALFEQGASAVVEAPGVLLGELGERVYPDDT